MQKLRGSLERLLFFTLKCKFLAEAVQKVFTKCQWINLWRTDIEKMEISQNCITEKYAGLFLYKCDRKDIKTEMFIMEF